MEKILGLIVAMHVRLSDVRNDKGATATEYALLVAFIAIVLIGGATIFGTDLSNYFSALGAHITRLGS